MESDSSNFDDDGMISARVRRAFINGEKERERRERGTSFLPPP